MTRSLIDQIEEMLDRKLDARFDAFEEKLDFKLDTRFDDFETKLDDKLDKKLDQKLDEKLGVFMEHIDDKFDSLTEAVQATLEIVGTLAKHADLDEVKDDVKTIKQAVRATNLDLRAIRAGV